MIRCTVLDVLVGIGNAMSNASASSCTSSFSKGDRGGFDGDNNNAIHLISRKATVGCTLARKPKIIDGKIK